MKIKCIIEIKPLKLQSIKTHDILARGRDVLLRHH